MEAEISTNTGLLVNVALGALLGACIGDAVGAPLENLNRTPTDSEVKQALFLGGGGYHRTAPGQVTDDGELTISCALGLLKCGTGDSPSGPVRCYDVNRVAESYAKWLLSTPFDAGMTTFETIGAAARMAQSSQYRSHLEEQGYAAVMRKAAVRSCSESKSNGCLMRASPIGVWASTFSDEKIAEIAMHDCALTNPHLVCQHAVAAYCIAIASLMYEQHNSKSALNRVELWINAHGCDEIKGWWREVMDNEVEAFSPHIGFIKIGWKHAFLHLMAETPYVDSIARTIAGGGDTDTNACIVGGLMGAYWGAESIPLAMREKVLCCNTCQGRKRPDFLSTRHLPAIASKLVSHNEAEISLVDLQ